MGWRKTDPKTDRRDRIDRRANANAARWNDLASPNKPVWQWLAFVEQLTGHLARATDWRFNVLAGDTVVLPLTPADQDQEFLLQRPSIAQTRVTQKAKSPTLSISETRELGHYNLTPAGGRPLVGFSVNAAPQESDLITTLLARLKNTAGQPKDPDAERLIRQAVTEQPDAPYYLVQTVLIQDLSLHSAQDRIAQLEQQLAQAAAQAQKQPTSFLGSLFGSRDAQPPAQDDMLLALIVDHQSRCHTLSGFKQHFDNTHVAVLNGCCQIGFALPGNDAPAIRAAHGVTLEAAQGRIGEAVTKISVTHY